MLPSYLEHPRNLYQTISWQCIIYYPPLPAFVFNAASIQGSNWIGTQLNKGFFFSQHASAQFGWSETTFALTSPFLACGITVSLQLNDKHDLLLHWNWKAFSVCPPKSGFEVSFWFLLGGQVLISVCHNDGGERKQLVAQFIKTWIGGLAKLLCYLRRLNFEKSFFFPIRTVFTVALTETGSGEGFSTMCFEAKIWIQSWTFNITISLPNSDRLNI